MNKLDAQFENDIASKYQILYINDFKIMIKQVKLGGLVWNDLQKIKLLH